MATYAPDLPSTTELHERYPLSSFSAEHIAQQRQDIASIISGSTDGLIAITGPCALTDDTDAIHREGDELRELKRQEEGLVTLHRIPPWKPRTRQEDWHGEETTNPTGAYRTLNSRSVLAANVALELGHMPHAERYGHLATFGWTGGRNADKPGLILDLAMHDTSLPIGIKNSLDGEIDEALVLVDKINAERGSDAAPAVLVYRGGENARTPEEWMEQATHAIRVTDGRVVIDVAHGGEMAHDPSGRFKKSKLGQTACMVSLARIMSNGDKPAGVMIEASDTKSPTDPTIPLAVALDGIKTLNAIRRGL